MDNLELIRFLAEVGEDIKNDVSNVLVPMIAQATDAMHNSRIKIEGQKIN